jgi:hypothetical protein
MKLQHIFFYLFPPAVVGVLLVWLAVEHQARLELSGEYQALKQQLQQMADLAARNKQLSNRLAQANAPKPLRPEELSELLRLRAEMGTLRRQRSALDRAREENRQMHAVLARYLKSLTETNAIATADYWPQNSWTNCGYSSPEAALKTLLWAGANGDLTNFFAGVDVEARTNLDGMFKGKTETEASIRLADETSFKSVQILGSEDLDNNTVVLTLDMERLGDFEIIKMIMKRTGDEWKFAGPQE